MKLTRAALCSLSLLGCVVALRKRRNRNDVQPAAVEAGQPAVVAAERNTCSIPNWLTNIAVGVVNGVISGEAKARDPTNVTLHADRYEIDLLGCNIGLEVDASVNVGGFAGAYVAEMACVAEECLEDGWIGCDVTEYTFDAQIKFGSLINALGIAAAQFNLCALTGPNNTVELGVDSVDPGAQVQLVIRKEGLLGFSIKGVKGLETDWGVLQNFMCGFSFLPGFIGSVLEQWCESLIEWLADKVQLHLKDDIDEMLIGLINRTLTPDSPTQAPTPGPPAPPAPTTTRRPTPAPTPPAACPSYSTGPDRDGDCECNRGLTCYEPSWSSGFPSGWCTYSHSERYQGTSKTYFLPSCTECRCLAEAP